LLAHGSGSNSGEVRNELAVAVFASPKVERNGSKLVHDRDGKAVLCHVDRLQVTVASVASVDTDVGTLLWRKNRKRFEAMLAAGGTGEAREVPFVHAEGAKEGTPGAVVLIAENGTNRLRAAYWAGGVLPGREDSESGLREPFSVRLEECESNEAIGGRGHRVFERAVPEAGQKLLLCGGAETRKTRSADTHWRGRDFRQCAREVWKQGQERFQLQRP